MTVRRGGWVGAAAALVIAACGGGSGTSAPTATSSGSPPVQTATDTPPGSQPTITPPAEPPPSSAPTILPVTRGAWTFYDAGQGLSPDIADVSADEAGNVYVAGGDALYAKRRDDPSFLRFDARNAGLTQSCYTGVPPESDPGFAALLQKATPPGPAALCPVVSVAGTVAGKAVIGFQGHGTDYDFDGDWAMDSGGADVVRFDGTTLARDRHVLIASPPNTICAANDRETHATSCSNPYDMYWTGGRRKLRQVLRIVANHRQGTAEYGDVWMGGTHATLSVLLANAAQRGFLDRTAGQPARWADAKDVWEHEHPAIYDVASNLFLTGYTHAIAVDSRSGRPWGANGFRTAYMEAYGDDLHDDVWWLGPTDPAHPTWIDVWPDGTSSPLGGVADNVESLSFCDDGTLWMGSSTHGLAVMDPGGSISGIGLPDPGLHGYNVYAVACDPSDRSLWIGLGWGGVMRYVNGAFTLLDPNGLPGFVNQPVRSIQIDRWSSPRRVYFAFMPTRDASGAIVKGGGVAEYSGP